MKKILLTIATAVGLFILLYLVLPFLFSKVVMRFAFHTPLNQQVINDLINNQRAGIYSWDTWFGRIYANRCSGPPYDYSQEKINCPANESGNYGWANFHGCLDGGTIFYDRNGNELRECGGMGGMGDGFTCRFFYSYLKAKDADYVSEIKYACITEPI